MIVTDNNPTYREELATEIARVVAYLSDLEGLQIGSYPTWKDWASGQRLFGAVKEHRPVTALRGRLISGREIVTKPVQIWSPEQRWARTVDGLYRLVAEGQGGQIG